MKEKKDDIIIRLQQDYLETGSSAVLEELYINILRLSFFILKYKRYSFIDYSEKDLLVRDIASNIICRLIEKQEIIIKTNSLAYLKRAIFYSSSPSSGYKKNITYFSNQDFDINKIESSKTIYEELMEKDFKDEVNIFLEENLKNIKGKKNRDILRISFFDCIYIGRPYERYLYKLRTKYLRDSFTEIMENFRLFLKDR